MYVLCVSKKVVCTCHTTWRHNAEIHSIGLKSPENLKYNKQAYTETLSIPVVFC